MNRRPEPPGPPPPLKEPYGDRSDPDAATAYVEQVGRWTYRITIHHGWLEYGPGNWDGGVTGWRVLGADRADRKARRVLARYRATMRRDQQRAANAKEIR